MVQYCLSCAGRNNWSRFVHFSQTIATNNIEDRKQRSQLSLFQSFRKYQILKMIPTYRDWNVARFIDMGLKMPISIFLLILFPIFYLYSAFSNKFARHDLNGSFCFGKRTFTEEKGVEINVIESKICFWAKELVYRRFCLPIGEHKLLQKMM